MDNNLFQVDMLENIMSDITFSSTRWPILASFAAIVVLCAVIYRIRDPCIEPVCEDSSTYTFKRAFFRHVRWTAPKCGTHVRIETILALTTKLTHPTPGGLGGYILCGDDADDVCGSMMFVCRWCLWVSAAPNLLIFGTCYTVHIKTSSQYRTYTSQRTTCTWK